MLLAVRILLSWGGKVESFCSALRGKMRAIIDEIIDFFSWLRLFLKNKKCKIPKPCQENVVIVGNGSSAASFPYKLYEEKNYKFCCVNYAAEDQSFFFSLRPKYYCLIDPLMYNSDERQKEKNIKLFKILESVDWEMNIICYKNTMPQFNNEKINFCYINNNTFRGKITSFKNRLYLNNQANSGFQNVIIAAIYFFIISKVDHIILTGIDMDFFKDCYVDENNNLYETTRHFYGEYKLDFSKLRLVNRGEIYFYFYSLYKTFLDFSRIAELGKKNGVRIVNTCLQSFVDSFEKKDSKNLIKRYEKRNEKY